MRFRRRFFCGIPLSRLHRKAMSASKSPISLEQPMHINVYIHQATKIVQSHGTYDCPRFGLSRPFVHLVVNKLIVNSTRMIDMMGTDQWSFCDARWSDTEERVKHGCSCQEFVQRARTSTFVRPCSPFSAFTLSIVDTFTGVRSRVSTVASKLFTLRQKCENIGMRRSKLEANWPYFDWQIGDALTSTPII